MGWKFNFWARLRDGNHALKLIDDQLTLVDPVGDGGQGGTYPNLSDAHPPFQIDGNFGCTSGIAAMLLQSHDGAIHLLPALPDACAAAGVVTGLRAYGGFEISFAWRDGQVQLMELGSTHGGSCRLRTPNPLVVSDGEPLAAAAGENPNSFFQTLEVTAPLISPSANLDEVVLEPTFLVELPTEAGRICRFVAQN
jgi:alpha-L-fucosidase 2